MTLDEVYELLYDWVDSVLDDSVVPVIQGNSNAPAPVTKPYVVINATGTAHKAGRASAFDPVTTTEIVDDVEVETTTSTYITDYTVNFDIVEVGGFGQHLQKLLDSIETPVTQGYFSSNKLAFQSQGDIVYLPRLIGDDKWERQCVLEIRLGFASETVQTSTYIETVEFINEIDHE